MKRPKRDAKFLLREIVAMRLANRPYVSVATVRHDLAKAIGKIQPATVTRYLMEFHKKGLVYNAGRGWYSCLAQEFKLNRESLASLVQELNRTFPLLDYSCWSTAQISSYGHHLLAKHVSFVYTDRDSMLSVFEFLRDKGYDAHLNPRGLAASQFTVRTRTVVIRPRVTTQPLRDHFVTIEGLLVDLFVESRDLGLMDTGECFHIFNNLTRQARVTMSTLLDYARKRKTAAELLLKSINEEYL